MIDKIKSVVGSVRFWMITTGSVSAYLGYVEANGFSWSSLFNAISIWIGVVAGIGTLDKIASLSAKK